MVTLSLLIPVSSFAQMVVTDPGVTSTTGTSSGLESSQVYFDVVDNIAETILVPVMTQVMNQLLNKVNNSIVNWVNSGFDGNPFYIDDPKQFFTNMAFDSASDVAGSVRTQLNNLEQCQDPNSTVSPELCNNFQSKTSERAILYALGNKAFSGTTDALATNPDTLKAFGQSLDQSTGLSLQGESILEKFQQDFTQGGLLGYEAILLDENATPVSRYLNTLAVIERSTEEDKQALDNAGTQLSETECSPANIREVKDAEGEVLSSYCLSFDVVTPSNIISSQLTTALKSKNESVVSAGASDNPYATIATQIASSALQSLTNNLLTAGFNKLTDVATNLVFNDEASNPSNEFANVTDVENPFAFVDQQDQNNLGIVSGGTFNPNAYLEGNPVMVEVDSSEVIVRGNNTLALRQDPLTSFATVEAVTGSFVFNNTTLNTNNLADNEFEVVRVTEDLNNSLPRDYYLVQRNNNFLSSSLIELDYDTSTLAISPRRENGAVFRHEKILELYRAQLTTINKLPKVAQRIDRACVLGPDQGWESRLRDLAGKESQKATRKDAKKKQEDNEWGQALDGLDYAVSLALQMARTGMQIDDPFSREYSIYLKEMRNWIDKKISIEQTMSGIGLSLAQLSSLESQYYNPSSSSQYTPEQVINQLKRLSSADTATVENIRNQELVLDQLEKGLDRYDEKFSECVMRKQKVFEPGMTVQAYAQIVPVIDTANEFEDLRRRILQDNTEILYCPWEEVHNPLRLNTAASSSISGLEDLLVEALAIMATQSTPSESPVLVKEFLDDTCEDYGFCIINKGEYYKLAEAIVDITDRIAQLEAEQGQILPYPPGINETTSLTPYSYRVRFPEGASGINNRKYIDIKCQDYYRAQEVDYVNQGGLYL